MRNKKLSLSSSSFFFILIITIGLTLEGCLSKIQDKSLFSLKNVQEWATFCFSLKQNNYYSVKNFLHKEEPDFQKKMDYLFSTCPQQDENCDFQKQIISQQITQKLILQHFQKNRELVNQDFKNMQILFETYIPITVNFKQKEISLSLKTILKSLQKKNINHESSLQFFHYFYQQQFIYYIDLAAKFCLKNPELAIKLVQKAQLIYPLLNNPSVDILTLLSGSCSEWRRILELFTSK